jgi:hypothetical protein
MPDDDAPNKVDEVFYDGDEEDDEMEDVPPAAVKL